MLVEVNTVIAAEDRILAISAQIPLVQPQLFLFLLGYFQSLILLENHFKYVSLIQYILSKIPASDTFSLSSHRQP